jgi:hypothetical protein
MRSASRAMHVIQVPGLRISLRLAMGERAMGEYVQ